MIKKLHALVFTLLLAGCSTGTIEYIPPVEPTIPIHQEDENMAENIALNHATGSWGGGGAPNRGVAGNMYDNDVDTGFGWEAAINPPPPILPPSSAHFLMTLDDYYYVSSVDIIATISASSFSWSISYWDGSSYVPVKTSSTSSSPGEAAINHITDKVRLDFTVSGYGYMVTMVNEFRIYSDLTDSGLRIKTPQGTIALAEDTEGVSALKIRDGSVTRSLLLVAPSDAAASPLRVRHNGVTYAVAKL